MIIRKLDEARAGDRNVTSQGWESARLLLADDGMGFSFHITTLYAGAELKMHYQNHLDGKKDSAWLGMQPETEIVCACVFNPPVTGREVHDETGAYPVATEAMRTKETA